MITPPGKRSDNLKVHLVDFGFVDKFIDDETKEHIKEGEIVNNFQGNLFYSSVNQMNFLKTSARDDVISAFYLVLF